MAERRLSLQSLVPDAERLLAFDSPELAYYLLTCLLTLPEGELNLHNLNSAREFTRGYPETFRQHIESSVSGAWAWLLGQGYLGQRSGSSDVGWVTVTPQGRRWQKIELTRRDASGSSTESSSFVPPQVGFPALGLADYKGVPPSEQLLRFLVRLVASGRHDRDLDFTFSSILTLFLFSADPVAVWFQAYVKEVGVSIESIVSRSKAGPQTIKALRVSSGLAAEAFLSSGETPTWSSSSKRLIEEASQIAQRTAVGREPILEPRHLMAAFIYSEIGHEDQLHSWGFNQEDWGTSFYRWTVTNYREEATTWLNLHQQVFRRSPRLTEAEPTPSPSTTSLSEGAAPDSTVRTQTQATQNAGPSTHVARDKWTIDDALGYYPYAYAIYRFLTDRKTAPPLAISIQAPWGGGKTSLMRMIQAQLDPDNSAFQREKTVGAPDQQTSATVKQIDDVIQAGSSDPKPEQIDVGTPKNRVTVWFNAWKYESTDQIWAGLADSIVKQVTERLSPVERELFFFRLHLKRLDIAEIRKKITDGVLSRLYELLVRWWWIYLVVPIATYYVQHWSLVATHVPSVSAINPLGGLLDLGLLVCHAILARKKNLSTPAKIALGDLVKAPNYDANLGFIHQVTEDLKITLELVAPSSRPLVIFIDDLDRCSPGKVSAVVEAINLFLAGEFEHCMFVLGIDDEVVAAALNKAHADVFAQMPAYARATSIGWRFMDKFVQLPFIMPPPTPIEMLNYAQSLLATKEKKGKLTLEARQQVATSVEEGQTGKSIEAIVEDVNQALRLDTAQNIELTKDAKTIAKMNIDINEFTDDGKGIAKIIEDGIKSFSRNPRDVKRFVNSFRFYYFLRSALLARQAKGPSVEQLSRWILLSLRWPAIVRWLRSTESDSESLKTNGLIKLVKLFEESKDEASWAKGAADLIGLDEKDREWVSDEQLFAFFKGEHELPETERLSFSIGNGLW